MVSILTVSAALIVLACACQDNDSDYNSNWTVIDFPTTMTSQWKNKNDEPVEAPMMLKYVEDAMEFYGSIYNSLQDGKLPPVIGLPSEVMNDYVLSLLLSAASKAASTRTKEQLLNLRNCYDFDFHGENFLDMALSDPSINVPEKYRPK